MPKGPVIYDKVIGIRLTIEDVRKLDALAEQTFRQRPDVLRCLINLAQATAHRDLILSDGVPVASMPDNVQEQEMAGVAG